jgi:hypothetical protein
MLPSSPSSSSVHARRGQLRKTAAATELTDLTTPTLHRRDRRLALLPDRGEGGSKDAPSAPETKDSSENRFRQDAQLCRSLPRITHESEDLARATDESSDHHEIEDNRAIPVRLSCPTRPTSLPAIVAVTRPWVPGSDRCKDALERRCCSHCRVGRYRSG